jgi:hypothetical protein
LEGGLDEVLDLWVLLAPHEDDNLVEQVGFWRVDQSELDSLITKFRVLLSVEESWENVVPEDLRVLVEKGFKSHHGSRPHGAVFVLVLENSQQFLGSLDVANVTEAEDGVGALIENGAGVNLVRPVLDPFVEESRAGAVGFLAGASHHGGEGQFDGASVEFVIVGLDETLEFLEEILRGVANVVWKRGNGAGDVKVVSGGSDNVTDEQGSWASSGNDDGVQEKLVFDFISSLHSVVGFLDVLVVQGTDQGDEGEGSDLVELLDVIVNGNGVERFMNFLDVGDELVDGFGLASRVKILSLVVEEEWLWGPDVLVFLDVILEFEFEVVVGLGVGWSGD